MIRSNLQEIANYLGLKHSGESAGFAGISTDTRKINKGELFVALKGPHFDANKLVNEAVEKGAAAIITNKDIKDLNVPYIKVDDTIHALGEIAKFWRCKFNKPVIAITGSNGKSTTKEMIANILSSRGAILKTEGNYNNLIGMPLTLLKWNENEWAAVLEMGMNAKGEIKRLTEIANPSVAVVTTVTAAHLESLHSIEAVANAKGELIENMDPTGVAIINDEDPWVRKMGQNFKGRVISFGMQNNSTVRFLHMERVGWDEAKLKIMVDGKEINLVLPVPGIHNVMNAMAAIAVSLSFDIEPQIAAECLRTFKPMSMRMERVQLANGVCLINDSYNANPASWKAALKTVSTIKRAGRFFAVLGDMLELGTDAKKLHKEAGMNAATERADVLYAWGEHSKDVEEGAKENGLTNTHIYNERNKLSDDLIKEMKAGDVVLVKGSRGSKMDEVVDYLKATFGSG